jgi:glucokinase
VTHDSQAVGGIDIGGTKIAVAIGDHDDRLLDVARFPTRIERGPHAILDETLETLSALARRANVRIASVGIGCAGPLDRGRGLVLSPPNLPGWDELPIVDLVERRLDVPVVFDNDANAAALGEHRQGAGRGLHSLVYMTMSTGIGGGVIVVDKLVHGVADAAGEIGHMVVQPNGPACNCGARGCLEAICSGTAIARRARERIGAGAESSMGAIAGGVEAITAATVARAALDGDPVARHLWDETIEYLALGIGNVLVTLAPEAIIIGGGVAAAGDQLFEPLRARVRQNVTMLPPDRVTISPAALGGDSGLYGALALGRSVLAEPR